MSKSENEPQSEVGAGWSSSVKDGVIYPVASQPSTSPALPTMSLHNDFISFLAVAQHYDIDFVSLAWQPGLGNIGIGGTSEVWQLHVDVRTSLAFKRFSLADESHHDPRDEEKAFNTMVSEISVLGHPLLRHHQNIVDLLGICWEFPLGSHKIWPVLILEKAELGDLQSFMSSEEAKTLTLDEKIGLCTDIASAIVAMHSHCEPIHIA